MSSPPDKDERTQKPTDKRRREFRKRGDIALSKDLSGLLTMFGAATVGALAGGGLGTKFGEHMAGSLARLDGPLIPALSAMGGLFVSTVMPVAIGALLGYLLSAALQLGWPPTLKMPKPTMPKLFNLGAVLSIISPKAMFGRVANSTAKVIVVGAAAAATASIELRRFVTDPALDASSLGTRLVAGAVRLGLMSAAALAALAVFDFFLAKRRMMAKMMMTKAELKREARESEGDPMIKRRRRQRMRELARRRIVNAVKTADVVLVNPTEYAVALRYKVGEDRAPRVVAKGRLVVAEHIRTLARAAGIPIISEPPLTRLIHKLVPEGREIPAQLYAAVAEVLAYVYKLRNRR